jgi:hypothetical protein
VRRLALAILAREVAELTAELTDELTAANGLVLEGGPRTDEATFFLAKGLDRLAFGSGAGAGTGGGTGASGSDGGGGSGGGAGAGAVDAVDDCSEDPSTAKKESKDMTDDDDDDCPPPTSPELGFSSSLRFFACSAASTRASFAALFFAFSAAFACFAACFASRFALSLPLADLATSNASTFLAASSARSCSSTTLSRTTSNCFRAILKKTPDSTPARRPGPPAAPSSSYACQLSSRSTRSSAAPVTALSSIASSFVTPSSTLSMSSVTYSIDRADPERGDSKKQMRE